MSNDSFTKGIVCSWCGTYFEKEHGYPVLCGYCFMLVERRALKSLNIRKSTHSEKRMDNNMADISLSQKYKNKNLLVRFLTFKII